MEMEKVMRSIEQSIGNVHVGDNSTANIGTFGHSSREGVESLQALFFKEMFDRQHDVSDASHGTCAWLLQDPTLRAWQDAQNGLLWIKGRPGAGKSTIMKYVLAWLIQAKSSKKRLIASFFCHGRGVDLQRTPAGIFRALLHQILYQTPKMQESFEKVFQARCNVQGHHGTKWDWTESELRTLLQEHVLTLCTHTEVFLLVDALDECGEENARELLGLFRDITKTSEVQQKRTLHVCVSSRHYPLIGTGVPYMIAVDDRNVEDIHRYAAEKLGSICRDNQELDRLLSAIGIRSGGIFQWTVLVVLRITKALERNLTLDSIMKDIEETPQELYPLYRQIVQSHMRNASINSLARENFRCLFQWVSLAKRPLTLRELRCALSVITLDRHKYLPVSSDYDTAWGEDIPYMSCGLISVNDKSSHIVVQFIHHSVQEYFVLGGGIGDLELSTNEKADHDANLRMVEICYRSILSYRPTTQTYERYHPFFEYSLRCMFLHARDACKDREGQTDLLRVLNWPTEHCVAKVWDIAKIWDFGKIWNAIPLGNGFDLSEQLRVYETKSLLHVAAAFDIPGLVSDILQTSHTFCINPAQAGSSVLHLAAKFGNDSVVERLMEIEQTWKQGTWLPWWQRRSRILQIDSYDREGYTPLMLAASGGHDSVVQRLLNTEKVQIDTQFRRREQPGRFYDGSRSSNQTSLHMAIRGDHPSTAKLLLQYGANVNIVDTENHTVLSLALTSALRSWSEDMLATFWSILPQATEDLYRYRCRGESPLYQSLSSRESGYFATGLLNKGVNPNVPDKIGRTWLFCLLSAERPDHKALELLLTHSKFDPNLKDAEGYSALLRLAQAPKTPSCIVKLLLHNPEVDVGSVDKDGKTALELAASSGSLTTVKILLNNGRFTLWDKDRIKHAFDFATRRWDQSLRQTHNPATTQDLKEILAILRAVAQEKPVGA